MVEIGVVDCRLWWVGGMALQITSAREALQHAAMHEQVGLPASASTILTIGELDRSHANGQGMARPTDAAMPLALPGRAALDCLQK
eukprot:COSAG02_NODE_7773_length_2853_cov_1.289760_2_plen_86_part_00